MIVRLKGQTILFCVTVELREYWPVGTSLFYIIVQHAGWSARVLVESVAMGSVVLEAG